MPIKFEPNCQTDNEPRMVVSEIKGVGEGPTSYAIELRVISRVSDFWIKPHFLLKLSLFDKLSHNFICWSANSAAE